mgnify:FL=1
MIKDSTRLEDLTQMLDHFEIKPLEISDVELCD